MKTKVLLYSAGLLVACAIAFAASGSESIETSVRNMFKALDAGDRVAFRAFQPNREIKFPVQFFDYDLENKPVAIEGVDAVNTYLESLFDEMTKRKMKVTSVISNLRSGSHSPELGFAIFDLAQTTTSGGKSETSRFRSTALLTQDKKTRTWRMFHVHATLVPSAPTAK
jgi:hypothetical protein